MINFKDIQRDRIEKNTLDLVNIKSVTGNTVAMAEYYKELLGLAGCRVKKYDYFENNPTLVATYGDKGKGKTLIFSGHMDVIPLNHELPFIKNDKIYGRGSCDMKGSLAVILEVLRIITESHCEVNGTILVVVNSLHESPLGRGQDLYTLIENIKIKADAAVVMEGAHDDCTIAQTGAATFTITIERVGQPCHELLAPAGTPNPIIVGSKIIENINRMNEQLRNHPIEDIGYGSYFVGRINSGKFYNQIPVQAVLEGNVRYDPDQTFESVRDQFQHLLHEISNEYNVPIQLDLRKTRDGYRIDKDSSIVQALIKSVKAERVIDIPFKGTKMVTDAGIFVNNLNIPTVCYGPNSETAHCDIEYVELSELETTARVYLRLIDEFLGIKPQL